MLLLHPVIADQLKAAVQYSDEERCGFLFGIGDEEDRTVTEIMPVENVSPLNKTKTFEISPDDYIRAEKYCDENKLQLIGVYHSHINFPAIPSEYDRVAAQPGFSYVIISSIDHRVDAMRSWKINDNFQFEEEQMSINHNNQHINGYSNHSDSAA